MHHLAGSVKAYRAAELNRMKTIILLMLNFIRERMCFSLCVCGSDFYFQQHMTLDKGRKVATDNTTTCCLPRSNGEAPGKSSDAPIHASWFTGYDLTPQIWKASRALGTFSQKLLPLIFHSYFKYKFFGRTH